MITDAFTRLSDAQDLSGLSGAGSTLSTDYIDTADRLGRSGASMLGIKERAHAFANHGICATFTVTTGFTFTDANETVRFQLIGVPTVGNSNAVVDFTAGDDTATCDNTFLPTGTIVTAGTAANGLSTGTHYYVVRTSNDPSDTTFSLSLTPNGSVVDITGSGQDVSLNVIPQILADSGDVPAGRLRLGAVNAGTSKPDGQRPGDQVMITTNPLPSSPTPPLMRYVYARYIVSAGVDTGAITADVGISVPDNRGIYYASGYEIK